MVSGSPTPRGYGPGAWQMIGRGLELGMIIGGLTYLGYLGDERFDTGPWLTLAGALLAMIGGSYNIAKGMFKPKRSNAFRQTGKKRDANKEQ